MNAAPIQYADADPYRPGVCNIGPAEIARRRRSAISLTIVALVAAALLVASGVPAALRIAVWPFTAAAGVTWLQVIRRFCVGFGAAGIRNFAALGRAVRVDDDEARAADRRMALKMTLEGSSYGLLVALALVLLPT